MSPDFTDYQSTLVQVMALCRQAASDYLNQYWPRSLLPYGVTRPQCVKQQQWLNYTNPVYGVAAICHQVRWLCWGHPSPFHTATSLLIWYKMFCVRDISYRLIWMEFLNMFSVYAQCGMHSHFNWWIIVVLTFNPSVLMCVEITDAPKL